MPDKSDEKVANPEHAPAGAAGATDSKAADKKDGDGEEKRSKADVINASRAFTGPQKAELRELFGVK